MKKEADSLKENKLYELVDLPKGKHVVGCKWVYKTR